MRNRLLVGLLAFASLAGCGGDATAPATPVVQDTTHVVRDTTHTVAPLPDIIVENNDFAPSNQTVTVGQTVTWKWSSCSPDDMYGYAGTCVSHGVVFADGTGSDIQSGGNYTRSFAAKGSYPYHCPIHGAAMSGTITVQ